MSEKFYNAIHSAGSSLKKAWDKVSGNEMLQKRGIQPGQDIKFFLGLGGIGGGILAGFVAGAITDSFLVWGCVAAAGSTLPVTGFLPYALYKAGEHDAKLRIENEKRGLLEAPKPALPKPPEAPLI